MTLVDTDVLIDAARGIPDALASLQTHGASGALAVSVITEMELIVGCRNKAELQALRRFLSRYSVRPVTAAVSQQASGLVEQFALSHGLRIPDALIAATALDGGLPLLTKNQRDFRFIPGLVLPTYP